MPQNELARPHFSRIPQIYQNSLRTWLDNGSVETFSEDELKLHRAAALAYADPRRPSIRSLHTMLCDMLTRDGSASGIPLQPLPCRRSATSSSPCPTSSSSTCAMAAVSASGTSSPMRDRQLMTWPAPARRR